MTIRIVPIWRVTLFCAPLILALASSHRVLALSQNQGKVEALQMGETDSATVVSQDTTGEAGKDSVAVGGSSQPGLFSRLVEPLLLTGLLGGLLLLIFSQRGR